jgi:hypothetical protein
VTSPKKINANRANASASTGPKTKQGRARSARNALRHGLSLPIEADPVLTREAEALAREIAGPSANAETLEHARRIAEAQIDLQRVRSARHQLLSRALNDPNYEANASLRQKLRLIPRLLRPGVPAAMLAGVEINLTSKAQGPSKFAMILSDCTKQLAAIDRYERRALSRRKFAIREFDSGR